MKNIVKHWNLHKPYMQDILDSALYHLSTFGSRLIWNTNVVLVLLERRCLYFYDKYPFIRNILHKCEFIWGFWFPKPQISLLQEPTENAWIVLCTNDNDDLFISPETIDNESVTQELFESKMKLCASTLSNMKNKINCCLIGNFHGSYFVRISDNLPKLECPKTTLSFLSIYYSHPSMKSKLELHVPEGMLYVGNELFNETFVIRALKMQPEPFVFDNQYEIQCMDSNVSEFSVFNNQYVYVNDGSFDVKTIHL